MKKIVRLNESDIVRLVKKVISENKKMLKEDYNLSNPSIKITKYTDNNKSNEIRVQGKDNTGTFKNRYYKINYSERLGSADGSDNYKVNFDKIRQNGTTLIVDRWIEGGKIDPIEIPLDDVKELTNGREIVKDTGLGKVFVKLFYTS